MYFSDFNEAMEDAGVPEEVLDKIYDIVNEKKEVFEAFAYGLDIIHDKAYNDGYETGCKDDYLDYKEYRSMEDDYARSLGV